MILINQEIRDLLCDINDQAIVFDNPDFDDAIIGITHDGKAVYDYLGMVHSLMKEDGINEEEAVDFIDYNTIRALPYAGEYAPVIVHFFDNWSDNNAIC